MPKPNKLLLFFLSFLLLLPIFLFADESITITTYYPSPYGIYNELTTTGNTYLATTSGNVGIGTTTPGAKLHVYDTTADHGPYLVLQNFAAGRYLPGIMFKADDGVGGANDYTTSRIVGGFEGGSSWSDTILGFENYTDSGWLRSMTVKNGNVGIGTTGPAANTKLHILKGDWQWHDVIVESPAPSLRLADSESGQAAFTWAADGSKLYLGASGYANRYATSWDSTLLSITSGGLVGIGTTTPNARLDLWNGYGANGEKFLVYNDNSSGALAGTKMGFYIDRFGANNLTLMFAEHSANPGSFVIAAKPTDGTAINPYLTVQGLTGRVGIGTTSPNKNLSLLITPGDPTAGGGAIEINSGTKWWRLGMNPDSNAGGLLFSGSDNTSGWKCAFRFEHNGAAYSDNSWNATGADYAEWFEKEEYIPSKSIVGLNIKTGKVRVWRKGDPFIGVHSINPGFIGNNIGGTSTKVEDMDKGYILVALIGQVEIKSNDIMEKYRKVMTSDAQLIGWRLANGKVYLK